MEEQEKTSVAIARMEERIQNLDRRMGNLEKLTETVNSLALSVQGLTDSIKRTNDDVEGIRTQVVELHDKPGKRWDTIVTAIITAVIGLI